MDFEDQLAAAGCTLTPVAFRRALLDAFDSLYDDEDLDALLTDPGEGAALTAAVCGVPGCEGLDDVFIIEALGRLLGDEPDRLTPTEVLEVGQFYQRRADASNAELKQLTRFYLDKFGPEILARLPAGITVDDAGEVHIKGEEFRPFDTAAN